MERTATEPGSATYHVFINHRGPDVKKTFASFIYHRLTNCHGLRVFLDNKELRTGDSLSPSILGAIQSASVHIALFTERYAESPWCLEELRWILRSYHKRNKKIIPVFCDVRPTDLRYVESGRYAEAFEEHQRKGRVAMEDIQKWKTALNEASHISGLLFKTDESDHGEFLERIVEAVLKGVKWEPLEVATYPVGLDQAVEDFQNEIMKQNDLNGTIIVGIAGMGGVGKSTLAKCFYNLKRSDFTRSCYLSEVREKDLPSLQHKLLRDLLGYDLQIDNTSQGKGIFRDRLRGHAVLIVLDDVDRFEQINSLLVTDVVGSGSLILITSRDQDLLRRCSPKIVLYNVTTLQEKHAQELFCWHAFLQSEPYKGFEDLVKEFLRICGGLPLSLQVLGAQLRQGMPDRRYWELQLKRFSRNLPEDIIRILIVSYQALNKQEKEMFLDIGCFLAGEDKDLVFKVLEGLGYNDAMDCLESLRQKCLVEYRYDEVQSDDNDEIDQYRKQNPANDMKYITQAAHSYSLLGLPNGPKGRYNMSTTTLKVTMHDHIKEMAKQIGRKEVFVCPAPISLRLSCSNDIQKLLMWQIGADSCRVRGIRIPKGEEIPNWTNYPKAVGVRLIVAEVPIASGSWNMDGDLVWLRLRNFSSICFPGNISLGRLRVLELQGHGNLEQLFHRFDEPPLHLSELNINVSDSTLPSTSSSRRVIDAVEHSHKNGDEEGETAPYYFQFRFLEWIGTSMKFLTKIVLKNMTFLQSLPIEFSELKSLRHLDLSGCTNMTKLPNSFSKLTNLQYVALRDCKNLSMPTDILGEISTLEYVDFEGCAKLLHLPRAMAYQRSLRYLNLLRTQLLQLPMNLELLDMLQQLRIGSSQLTELQHSMGDLMRLEELILIECLFLKRILPEEVAGPNIKVMVIDGAPLIDHFIFEYVGRCVLRDFTLKNTSISEICIPEGVYSSLETVDLSQNFRLKQVYGLPSRLVRLNLQSCRRLETLTHLSNLVNLKFLNINGCLALKTLNLQGLTLLQEIKAEACWALKKIEGLSQREWLNCLHISSNNGVMWNDICEFLTSREILSTAIFSGKADDEMMLSDRELRCIMGKFKLKMMDIVFAPTSPQSQMKIENLHSYGAIVISIISLHARSALTAPLRVRFKAASNDDGPAHEYTALRYRDGRSLHLFIWTDQSNLFKDYEGYRDIHASFSDDSDARHSLLRRESNRQELTAGCVKRGWMVMVDKNMDVSKVCREFINAFA